MNKVFSRWPSRAPPLSPDATGKDEVGLPRWMVASPQSIRTDRRRSGGTYRLAILAGTGSTLAACLLIGTASGPHRWLAFIAALCSGIGLAAAVHMNRSLARCEDRFEAIFERAGISMWLEDWSAAAAAVASLLQSGVHDMEAHFATRPDELRALCGTVMITDVNSFTVEEAAVGSKDVFLGSLDKLLPETDQTFVQWLVAIARGDRYFRSEAHISTPDGTEVDTLFTAALPGDIAGFSTILVTSLDITNYKREQTKLLGADAEIARASRASTVGALSASIAHEVNSPLAAVVANAQAALRWLQRPVPDVSEALDAVSAIIADATRAKDVVARTRSFVSNAAKTLAPLDLVAAAREANMLVERDLRRSGATVSLLAEPDLPRASGDMVQIQQVFTNLLLNAAQAMAGKDCGKEITVSFKSDGQNIRVEVADEGPGISAKQLEHVFDPFYTTREGGIGMGLAICRNCIDGQGGNIWATSKPNGGATFNFTLPVHND